MNTDVTVYVTMAITMELNTSENTNIEELVTNIMNKCDYDFSYDSEDGTISNSEVVEIFEITEDR